MNLRAHPTVRPYALALGVFPRRDVVDRLAIIGPALAQDIASALLLDTLGALSTFPVRHRVVFTDGDDAVTRQTRMPATWRELAQRGKTASERLGAAFDDLVGLGAEAVLLVSGDGPALPLGAMFDGLMWLLPKKRMLVGALETGGLFAIGAADRSSLVLEPDALGIAGTSDDVPTPDVEDRVVERASEAGIETQRLPRAYRVDGLTALKRLKAEVAGGSFAPHCRKLFERPELAPF